jgi:hypothetical protein
LNASLQQMVQWLEQWCGNLMILASWVRITLGDVLPICFKEDHIYKLPYCTRWAIFPTKLEKKTMPLAITGVAWQKSFLA